MGTSSQEGWPKLSDYYDPGPLIDLPRPVALAGWLGRLTREVGYRSAALLGLTFSDLDRLVEHRAGESIASLVAREGEFAYRMLETECFARLLRQRPAGLVALGDGALLAAGNQALAREQCDLVLLNLDLAHLYWRVQSLSTPGAAELWTPTYEAKPSSLDELRPFYERRRPGFAGAEHRLEVAGCTSDRLSRRLIELIKRLAATASPS